MTVPWQPFKADETALDFGRRYIFVDAAGKRMSVRWSMGVIDGGPPREAAWCLPWEWLAKSIPEQSA